MTYLEAGLGGLEVGLRGGQLVCTCGMSHRSVPHLAARSSGLVELHVLHVQHDA